MDVCLLCAVCCHVEVSATDWSLVQRVLPTVARRCVWSRNLENEEAKARYRAVKNTNTMGCNARKTNTQTTSFLEGTRAYHITGVRLFQPYKQHSLLALNLTRTLSHLKISQHGHSDFRQSVITSTSSEDLRSLSYSHNTMHNKVLRRHAHAPYYIIVWGLSGSTVLFHITYISYDFLYNFCLKHFSF
jgi:hypothetical protein